MEPLAILKHSFSGGVRAPYTIIVHGGDLGRVSDVEVVATFRPCCSVPLSSSSTIFL